MSQIGPTKSASEIEYQTDVPAVDKCDGEYIYYWGRSAYLPKMTKYCKLGIKLDLVFILRGKNVSFLAFVPKTLGRNFFRRRRPQWQDGARLRIARMITCESRL